MHLTHQTVKHPLESNPILISIQDGLNINKEDVKRDHVRQCMARWLNKGNVVRSYLYVTH